MKHAKFFLLPIAIFLFTISLKSEVNTSKINNLPIITIGKEQITYEQLDRAYQKNISKQKPHLYLLEKDSLMDFINLYTNYRLKVQDALSRGLDKDSSIKAESNQNRKILAESFLFEKVLTEPNVNIMLNRRKLEYKIAVIFTTFSQTPTRDTANAFKKINEALVKLNSGAEFSQIASQYCDDENLAKKGGVVDQWITSGKIARELEDVIYSLNVGQYYPQIVSTPYGYFIIKVLEKQPRNLVMGGHILYKQKTKNEDLNLTQKVADSALVRIKNGASFEDLAKNESGDKYSAENGGSFDDLYSLSTGFEKSKGFLEPIFAEAMFKLKDGEISNVITTEYGFHIIKRYFTKDINLDTEKEDVRKIYKKQYFDNDKQSYLNNIAKQIGLSINENQLEELISTLDTNKNNISKNWADSIPKSILKKELFKTNSKSYSVKDFVEEMSSSSQLKGFATNKSGLIRAINKFIEPQLIEYATNDLEKKYPEFQQLLSEFNDGILLFKVETMEVWNKLSFDSIAAKKYYEANKSTFKTEPKFDLAEIYVLSDSLAQDVYKKALNGDNFDTLATHFTQRTGYREKSGAWGVVSSVSNKLGKLAFESNVQGPILLPPKPVDNGFAILKINQYFPPRPKTFEEAIPDFASKLQDQTQKVLLNNWLQSLKKKFPVKLNTKNIDELLKFAKTTK